MPMTPETWEQISDKFKEGVIPNVVETHRAYLEKTRQGLDAWWHEKDEKHFLRLFNGRKHLNTLFTNEATVLSESSIMAELAPRQSDVADRLDAESATALQRMGWATERMQGALGWREQHAKTTNNFAHSAIEALNEILAMCPSDVQQQTAQITRMKHTERLPEVMTDLKNAIFMQEADQVVILARRVRSLLKGATQEALSPERFFTANKSPVNAEKDSGKSLVNPSPAVWAKVEQLTTQAEDHSDPNAQKKALQGILVLLEADKVEMSKITDKDPSRRVAGNPDASFSDSMDKMRENINRATGWSGTTEYDLQQVQATAQQEQTLVDQAATNLDSTAVTVAQTYAAEKQMWEDEAETHGEYHTNHHYLTVEWTQRALELLTRDSPSLTP